MRTLARNKIRIYYANFRAKIPLKDEYGNLTGEYEILYDNPTAIKANVSAARGEAVTRQFGDDEGYDRVIVLDSRDATDILAQCGKFEFRGKTIITDDGDGNISIESEDIQLGSDGDVAVDLPPLEYVPRSSMFPITASSVFWIDTPPEIAADGTTDTPHDYIVKQIATSLNSVSIAVSKVSVA